MAIERGCPCPVCGVFVKCGAHVRGLVVGEMRNLLHCANSLLGKSGIPSLKRRGMSVACRVAVAIVPVDTEYIPLKRNSTFIERRSGSIDNPDFR